MVGDEPGLPYQRPPLSKAYLMGKTTAEALSFRPEKFFADNKIELIAQTRVTAIDRANRGVALSTKHSENPPHLATSLTLGFRSLSLRRRATLLRIGIWPVVRSVRM